MLNTESSLIKAVCKNIVYNSDSDIESLLKTGKVDWDLLKLYLEYHELTSFFYLAIKEFQQHFPQEIFQGLSAHYLHALADNLKMAKDYKVIDSACKEQDIDLLPLKGVALLKDVYTDIFIRRMRDIDVIVKEQDIRKAENVLCGLGYKKILFGLKESYWLQKQCHLTFTRRRKNIDLHWGIDFKRKGKEILPELWDRTREIRDNGGTMKLLSPEDTFFSLSLHTRRFGKSLRLKNVLDAALLLNKYKNEFDWDYVSEMADKYELNTVVFFMLAQLRYLLDKDIAPINTIKVSPWKKRSINGLIDENTFSPSGAYLSKDIYLKSHFLLYDDIRDAIAYIVNIPREQFAKFYGLKPYDKKTSFLYSIRLLYMAFKFLCRI